MDYETACNDSVETENNNVLVVKCNVFLKRKEFSNLYENILRQKETGVILLPPYCDIKVVPPNIKIVDPDEKEVKS